MMKRRDFAAAAVAQGLGLWSGAAIAQTKATGKKSAAPAVRADERVNDVLAPVRDEHHLPGLIGALLVGEKLAAIGALGIRKIGAPDLMRVTDLVHLGSCTKAMTATMIGTLVDQGKLTWGSTFRELFPNAAKELHSDFQTVTLAQLLNHRAGLPNDGPWWNLSGTTTTQKRRDLLYRMLKDAPENRPGSTYRYSNVGYALAGLMAEQVTGQSWEELMRGRLFEPLGMTSAGFGSPGHAGRVDQPWGHHAFGDEVRPTLRDNAPAMGPAGTVHCTVPDWAKFVALHLRAARGTARLLKPPSFRALHTPPRGGEYAGGWKVVERSWANGLALAHSGSNSNWFTAVWIAPARGFAVLAATNQGGESADTACDQAVTKLIESAGYLAQTSRRR
jgi:CubicO group peptidase (beta-lactamase class C family)